MRNLRLFAFVAALMCLAPMLRGAERWDDAHEDPEPVWHVAAAQRVVVTAQRRQSSVVRNGHGAEQIDLNAARDGDSVQFEYEISAAYAIEDLQARLAVRADRAGCVLCFRAVLPHETDPRTGKQLTFLIRGETYRRAGEWQELSCGAGERPVTTAINLLRQLLNRPRIDTSDMFVDRVVVKSELRRGGNTFYFDDLQVAGIIPLAGAGARTRIVPVAERERVELDVRMRSAQLFVGDRPFFPRIVPDHGESPGLLTAAGFNTVWIPDIGEEFRKRALNADGLALMATPDQPRSPTGAILDPDRATLAPFTEETDLISFWYLGTSVPSSSRDELIARLNQVSSADRRRDRPILADIAGSERVLSRRLSMTSCSRPVINTSWSFHDYYRWLSATREMCLPGSFFWTWIDVDAGGKEKTLLERHAARGDVIEPEQLRLQVYAALSAGCRGLGFWSRGPLDEASAGREETRLMLSLLNRELSLLEPILASGKLSKQPAKLQIEGSTQAQSKNRKVNPRANMLQFPSANQGTDQGVSSRDVLEAAVIEQGSTMLLLPVWYQHEAQYVPGEMYARSATLIVPPPSDTAAAWLLTAYGLRNLELDRRVAGGPKIQIEKFDQTAIVILTSDFEVIRQLKDASMRMAKTSAADGTALARAKYERVRNVEAELEDMGVHRPESERLLEHAEMQITLAERQFRNDYYSAAAELAADALRTLRALQRIRWNDARRDVKFPGMRPFLYSYQTLPLHYKFLALVETRSRDGGRSLLRSGSFESVESLVEDGWVHVQFHTEHARAAAALDRSVPPGVSGQYCLRLAAGPVDLTAPPPVFERPLVRYSTPKIPVEPGEVLSITGWMRIRFPGEGRLDRGLISDNLTGETGSLRFETSKDWQKFELLRVADDSGYYQLSFALEGLGEMQIDEVRIVSLPAALPPAAPPAAPSAPPSFRARDLLNPRDLINRIPGMNRLPGMNEQKR